MTCVSLATGLARPVVRSLNSLFAIVRYVTTSQLSGSNQLPPAALSAWGGSVVSVR